MSATHSRSGPTQRLRTWLSRRTVLPSHRSIYARSLHGRHQASFFCAYEVSCRVRAEREESFACSQAIHLETLRP